MSVSPNRRCHFSIMNDIISELTWLVVRIIKIRDLGIEKYLVVILPGEAVRDLDGWDDRSVFCSLQYLSRESCKFSSS